MHKLFTKDKNRRENIEKKGRNYKKPNRKSPDFLSRLLSFFSFLSGLLTFRSSLSLRSSRSSLLGGWLGWATLRSRGDSLGWWWSSRGRLLGRSCLLWRGRFFLWGSYLLHFLGWASRRRSRRFLCRCLFLGRFGLFFFGHEFVRSSNFGQFLRVDSFPEGSRHVVFESCVVQGELVVLFDELRDCRETDRFAGSSGDRCEDHRLEGWMISCCCSSSRWGFLWFGRSWFFWFGFRGSWFLWGAWHSCCCTCRFCFLSLFLVFFLFFSLSCWG